MLIIRWGGGLNSHEKLELNSKSHFRSKCLKKKKILKTVIKLCAVKRRFVKIFKFPLPPPSYIVFAFVN